MIELMVLAGLRMFAMSGLLDINSSNEYIAPDDVPPPDPVDLLPSEPIARFHLRLWYLKAQKT